MRTVFVVGVVGVVSAIVGCSIGETNYETVRLPVREKKESRACDSPFVDPNLAELPACGDGKGHCFPVEKTPLDKEILEACPSGGSCIADKFLKANGTKAKSCTFFLNGKPGACVSLLVKDINANKDQLKQDVCEPDERCAPCTHPIENYDTHLCDPIGVHEKECTKGSAQEGDAESCCHGMGLCMAAESVPAESREDTPKDTCPNQKLCAPTSLIDGKPVKCDVLGFDGVCLDVCFSSMLKGATTVMRSSCGPTEVCLPCAVGKSNGVPGCD